MPNGGPLLLSGPLPALGWKRGRKALGTLQPLLTGRNPCLQRAEQNSWPGRPSPSEGPDATPESAVGPEVLRRHSRLKSPWTPDFPGALCKAAQLLPDPAPPGCIFFQKNKQMVAEPNAVHSPRDQKAWPAGPGCSSGGRWEKLLVTNSDKASQRDLE